MLRRRLWAAACVALTMLLAACKAKDEGETAEAPRPVTVELVARGVMDHVITADAILFPINQANITAKISSPIKKILVNRGDHVRAGQLLFELESADLAAAAEEAGHQYRAAEAAYQTLAGATVPEDMTKAQADAQAARQTLKAARQVYENRVALEKEGALAQKLVDDAKVAMVQAQSQWETAQRHLESLSQVSRRELIRNAAEQAAGAKAHYDIALAQLSYAQVRSPLNGVVADRQVYLGEIPPSGSSLISIVDISQIVARANVPVKEASAIHTGCAAQILGIDGGTAGKVTVVSPSVDPNSTTVQVWVQSANPGERLKPGSAVRVAITAATIPNALIVPASALLNSDEGGGKVMVVTGDSIAHERKVETGIRQGGRLQIVAGVREGDRVITSGGFGLDDGAKVQIESSGPESAP